MRERRSRRHAALLFPLLLVVAASGVRAADEEEPDGAEAWRGSFQIRFGESPPFTEAHDAGGVSVGALYGRYLGFDLSMDSYELFLIDPEPVPVPGKVAELSFLGFAPLLRLRYPLFDDRLEPYLLGGGGVAVYELNDRTADVSLPGGNGKEARGFGVVGGGIEYYLASNAAFGLEGRYFIAGSEDFDSQGTQSSIGLDVGIVTLGLRVLYPELPDERGPPEDGSRGAVSVRVGGAYPLQHDVFPGFAASPEQTVFGSDLSQSFGASIGYQWSSIGSVELAVEQYELELSSQGVGTIGEYSLFPITLQPRLRLPPYGGNVAPYAFAGIGVELGELNDKSENGYDFQARDAPVIGALGAGIEYFFASNASFGVEAKYTISRGHVLELPDGSKLDGNLDALLLSLGLRVLFG